jgi:biopolymer transport protein TolQ
MHDSVFGLILQAGLFVKLVLLVLLMFSVISWAIIFYKQGFFRSASKESESFLKTFRHGADPKTVVGAAKSLPNSPLARIYAAAHAEHARAHDELRRVLRRYEALEFARLHAYLTFLGTTGSTAPFIGLLGTVWGIMNAFRSIGASGSASLAVVAPGIAEALITTAAGLAAAIPAVMAYNYFLSRARRLAVDMEDFSEELLDTLGAAK